MDAMLLLKASLLLLAALVAARLLRRGPAVTRHRLWSLAFAAVLALPLFGSVLPAIDVPVPSGWRVSAARETPVHFPGALESPADVLTAGQHEESAGAGAASIATQPASSRSGRFETARLRLRTPAPILAAWLAGTLAAAGALFLSLLRARRLARMAEPLADPAWQRAADSLGPRLGLRRRARLLVSAAVGTPMAGGIWSPVIFLPASARTWSTERRDVVLAHEIAHLAGRDPLRHVAARLAVALYWFHPLAWIAARQATVAREQACDEAVLALGTRPSTYARVLLDFAESTHSSPPPLGALPMVEPSLLETRLMAILRDDIRPSTRRTVLIPAIGVALLTLAVAAAQPAPVTRAAALAPEPVASSAPQAVPQPDVGRDSACWWDLSDGSSFSGSISTSDAGGRTVIREQVGTRGADRVIQKSFGDLRLCMIAEGVGPRDNAQRPSQWLGQARRTIMEARRGTTVHRLEVGGRVSWQVGSAERPFDAAAQAWRDRMLAVFDTTWELATLRGEVSSLRGEISSIHGQESSLRGEISSLRGEVSSMRGRASSIQGEESSLRGRISSIQGHVSALQGAISSERGAISSLNAGGYRAGDSDRGQIAERIRRHDAEIARLERAIVEYGAREKITAVEREIAALDAAGKAAKIDAAIRAFDLEGKVALVERRMAGLDVPVKVAAIERRIAALDADRRGRQLEERRDAELKQLEAAIGVIR